MKELAYLVKPCYEATTEIAWPQKLDLGHIIQKLKNGDNVDHAECDMNEVERLIDEAKLGSLRIYESLSGRIHKLLLENKLKN